MHKILLLFLVFYQILFPFSISLKPVGFLNDYAGILKEEERGEIEQTLKDIEEQTGNEIAVVTVNSLGGISIEEYANELFNNWGIGKKNKDNGVLILVALEERKIRIEVGYGLEGNLPDAVCGRIIRKIIAPEFKTKNYYKGIKEAITTIDKLTKGESVFGETQKNMPSVFFAIFWFLFCIIHSSLSSGIIGFSIQILTIAMLLFLFKKFSPVLLLIPFILTVFLAFFSSWFYSYKNRKLKKYYGKRRKKHRPFWIGDYSSGGGFRSGSGGFGGGGSGGGGASGSW